MLEPLYVAAMKYHTPSSKPGRVMEVLANTEVAGVASSSPNPFVCAPAGIEAEVLRDCSDQSFSAMSNCRTVLVGCTVKPKTKPALHPLPACAAETNVENACCASKLSVIHVAKVISAAGSICFDDASFGGLA